MIEFTPISCPAMFTSAPPELPGLIGASVWMAPYTDAWLGSDASGMITGRCRALMMPAVTVPSRPYGDPTAATAWPTSAWSESPISMTGRSLASVTLSRARSVLGSRPTSSASALVPSLKETVRVAPPVSATATTWLLVMMSPSAEMTEPDPVPPVPSGRIAVIFTTEGSTFLATELTDTMSSGSRSEVST